MPLFSMGTARGSPCPEVIILMKRGKLATLDVSNQPTAQVLTQAVETGKKGWRKFRGTPSKPNITIFGVH